MPQLIIRRLGTINVCFLSLRVSLLTGRFSKNNSAMPKPFRGNNTPVSSLVGLAILVGILVGFGLSTIGYGAKFQLLSQSLPAQTTLNDEVVWVDQPPVQTSPSASDELSLEHLTEIVSKTNGFYARDYSLWLGWNNVCHSSGAYLCVLTINDM